MPVCRLLCVGILRNWRKAIPQRLIESCYRWSFFLHETFYQIFYENCADDGIDLMSAASGHSVAHDVRSRKHLYVYILFDVDVG